MDMFLLLGMLAGGALLGLLFREATAVAAVNRRLTGISLWALLAAMGAKLAQHRELFTEDLKVFFFAIGSSVALTLLFFLVFMVACMFKTTGPAKCLTALVSDDHPAAGRPSGPRELLSVAVSGGCVVFGALIFWLLPADLADGIPIDASAEWLLRALLFFIGMDLGASIHRLNLRRLTPFMLLAPFLNIALSLAAGMLFGAVAGMGSRGGALLTAGMGWYSLSSVMIAERGMLLLSILAFIHNVFRELLAILSAPLAARLSPMLPIYLGGATSMDVMLPFVQRHCGREYTLPSFYSGMVCSIAVMPLVKLIAG